MFQKILYTEWLELFFDPLANWHLCPRAHNLYIFIYINYDNIIYNALFHLRYKNWFNHSQMMFKAWVIMKETLKEQCREKIMAFFYRRRRCFRHRWATLLVIIAIKYKSFLDQKQYLYFICYLVASLNALRICLCSTNVTKP